MVVRPQLLAACFAFQLGTAGLVAAQSAPENQGTSDPDIVIPPYKAQAIAKARGDGAAPAIEYSEREQAAIDLAIAAVAAGRPVSRDQVDHLRIRAVDWPDGSLGCPEPGHVYTQQIVPGYFVSFSLAEEIYTVHVGNGVAKPCDRFEEVMNQRRQLSAAYLESYQAARIDLAERLYVEPDEIDVTRMRRETWADSSLGCPVEGQTYEAGPFDGVVIQMSCRDHQYEYRTVLEGERRFVICGELESCHETE